MHDALATILDSVRLRASVFSRASLGAPWGVEAGDMATGIFHAVVSGSAWASLEGSGDAVRLGPGDIVLMPFGHNHLMTDAPDRPVRPIAELTAVDRRGMGQLVVDGGGDHTSLICGTLEFDEAAAHPVLSSMPPLVAVHDVDGRAASLLHQIIALIAEEVDHPQPGAATVVTRLAEVLVVHALRSHIQSLSRGTGGWLGGLKDPMVADALGVIHDAPHHAWTTAELAATVGSSRSAFHRRFRDVVGETPAEYITRWRIHLATRILRTEDASVAATARRVGYRTEAAFSNAFVRVMGMRPGAYKKAA